MNRRANQNQHSPRKRNSSYTLCPRCRRPIPLLVPICRCGTENPKYLGNQKQEAGPLVRSIVIILIMSVVYFFSQNHHQIQNLKKELKDFYDTVFEKDYKKHKTSAYYSQKKRASHSMKQRYKWAQFRRIFSEASFRKRSDMELMYFAQKIAQNFNVSNPNLFREYLYSRKLQQRILAVYCLAILGENAMEWDRKKILQLLKSRIQEVHPEIYPREGKAFLWALAKLKASSLQKEALTLRWKGGPLMDFWNETEDYYREIAPYSSRKKLSFFKLASSTNLKDKIRETAIRAILLYEKGKTSYATELLEQTALTLRENDKMKYFPVIGQAFLVMNQYYWAEKYLREALKLGNRESKIYFYLGISLLRSYERFPYQTRKKIADKAYQLFYRAFQTDPNLAESYYYMGELLLRYPIQSFANWTEQRKRAVYDYACYLALSPFPRRKEKLQKSLNYWLSYLKRLNKFK
ncbi:MAG: hypothetical protein D6785_06770 [Planctomycetota bacterium]|nr:MAG: hypothetical protein D6785_06770 [Planctomycetota bacterium]